MPTNVVEGTVKSFTYDQLMQWANLYGQSGSRATFQQWANEAAKYGVGEEEALLSYLSGGQSGLKVQQAADGTYRGWFYNAVEQTTNTNPINSNASTISRGSLRQMVGQKFTDVQGTLTRNMVTFPASGGLGQQAAYVLGSVGYAVQAVSAGIWLGKTIDGALYSANPDYWDSIGLSSLNPETWNSITNGDDSPFAGLFNFILGLDPDTGTSQMYMDENALAYMAYALAQNGWFDVAGYSETFDETSYTIGGITYEVINPHPTLDSNIITFIGKKTSSGTAQQYTIYCSGTAPIYSVHSPNSSNLNSTDNYENIYFFSSAPFTYTNASGDSFSASNTTYNNVKVYYYTANLYNSNYKYSSPTITSQLNSKSVQIGYYGRPTANIFRKVSGGSDPNAAKLWLLLYEGTITQGQTVDGVGDQPNATLPDTSTWTDIPSTLQSLQNQYPDAFNNPMVWDNYNDDGTANQTTWIPVPFPNATSAIDTQPTSGTQTQTSTDVSQIPQELIDLLTQIVQQTQTQTDTETEAPPQNPVDTGTGNSPAPVAPTGSASALWSVYHPTQAQVDAFGGWLWSADFVDQLMRVFENPMDAVVSLRKVFVTPIDAGNTTIHAGYLDSEVPSAYITQQYVYQDCGYVDCTEQFGNVFDYTNTNVSVYLPFIGIVPLNTTEVMRSTLHIIYGVDMFTGACLATIEVTRDGNTVTMYQYSGNASVEYPLSGQRAASFLNGLMSIGGATALAATGGGSVVAAGMAYHGIQQMSTVNVQHSGSFTGNAGAMGIKTPYLIIERPQTKVAETFPRLAGYPTNYSCKLSDCSNHVVVKHVHVEGIPATDTELAQIESLLKDGVLI